MDNQCCLCGKEGKKVAEGIYVCDGCVVEAVTEVYGRRQKRSWYKPKLNWGFWVLIIGFIVYLVTWYLIKPVLEK